MAAGQVQIYNVGKNLLLSNTGAQWDDGAALFSFGTLTTGYTFDPDHADLTAAFLGQIKSGALAPIASANRTQTIDNATDRIILSSDDADWGTGITDTVKALVCWQGGTTAVGTMIPVFYQDLNTASGAAVETITNGPFARVPDANNGWLYFQ